MAIRKIDRPKRPGPPSVRQRELNVRVSMDDAEISYHLRKISEALWYVEEDTRYLTLRQQKAARRERLRRSGAVSWLWLYCLILRKSKYAVLYDLMCTPAHRELCGRTHLNARGEGLGRDEGEGELEDVRRGLSPSREGYAPPESHSQEVLGVRSEGSEE